MICRSVCHTGEPCKNGSIDRDAVWVEDSGGSREPCIKLGPDLSMERGNFKGEGWPIVKYMDTVVTCAKTAEPIEMPFGLCARTGPRNQEFDGGCAETTEPIDLPFGFMHSGWAEGSTNSTVFARWRLCTRRHSAVSCAQG